MSNTDKQEVMIKHLADTLNLLFRYISNVEASKRQQDTIVQELKNIKTTIKSTMEDK
jgi:hypothetical protein